MYFISSSTQTWKCWWWWENK